MSLSVWVGGLSACLKSDDREERGAAKRDLREINRLLVANGFPRHKEPETLPRMRNRYRGVGLPYDWLHYLRRAIAFAKQEPEEFTPVRKGEDPSEDEHILHELFCIESHIICHSDCEGYYVPVDFPDPLYHDDEDEIGGGILGSSFAGMRELLLVAPLINIPLRRGAVSAETVARVNRERRGARFYIERQVWLELFEAFRLSIKHGTAVKFN